MAAVSGHIVTRSLELYHISHMCTGACIPWPFLSAFPDTLAGAWLRDEAAGASDSAIWVLASQVVTYRAMRRAGPVLCISMLSLESPFSFLILLV